MTAETATGGRVLVVGCGLMGTSVGLAATRGGRTVHLSDRHERNAAIAESLGAGTTRLPSEVDLVVVAVPPTQVPGAVVTALRDWPEAVVTDVSSVKAAPLVAIERDGVETGRYVGGHPMAGSERSGPVAASAALFEGRVWVVTPHPATRPDVAAAVRAFAHDCGAGSVTTMEPAEHDRAVALVSHLPHLLSVLAASRLLEGSHGDVALAGQGLRDVTRVAAGNPRLWRQILTANAFAVADLLREVRDDIDVVLDVLDDPHSSQTEDPLEAVLVRGASGTALIPGRHGAPEPDTTAVYVQIPDAPGELARLFGDAEESGVNVEDVRIDHELGRLVGVAELTVLTDRADDLTTALTSRGWTAYR